MARQVRIAGLVRAAEMVRRELATPLSAEQRERLRRRVEENLLAVQRILREERGDVRDLPAPSQRAYYFLAGLEWKKTPTSDPVLWRVDQSDATAATSNRPAFTESSEAADRAPAQPAQAAAGPGAPASLPRISWSGLGNVLETAMEALAEEIPADMAPRLFDTIARASRQIELTIHRQSVSPDRMSVETRARRGWLSFFSRRENFDAYIRARQCANRVLDAVAVGSRYYPPPLEIHFRPMQGIYKLRWRRTGAVLWLPTPMIVFDEGGFAAIASLIYDRAGDARQRVIGLMTSDAYQTVRAELESLGGIVEQSRGAVHDLAASFDRVNAGYFGGAMVRPTLTWNRTFTGRKFGHYDFVNDTLMVSRSLDSAHVPEFAVDFLVFHELLHKYHGLHWVNGRGYAHTGEFQRDERRFAQFEKAEAVLTAVARKVR